MFCTSCGTRLPDGVTTCARCGDATARPSYDLDVGAIVKANGQILKTISRDPIKAVPKAFHTLEKRRAMEVGIAFGVLGAICILIGVSSAIPPWARGNGSFPVAAFLPGAILFGALTGTSSVARSIFGGAGSIEGDVLIAGAALVPLAVLMLLAAVLGVSNYQLLLPVSVVAGTWTVFLLHGGLTGVSMIAEAKAAPAVALVLTSSVWITGLVLLSMW